MNRQEWEPASFAVIDQFLPDEGVFFDIGSFIGPLSLYAANRARQVVAAEPDPLALEELEANLALNPELQQKTLVIPKAITPTSGQFALHARVGYGYSSSSLMERAKDGLASHLCEGITLSSLYQTHAGQKPDLIKIDIEGGEFSLLPAITDDLKAMGYPTLLISFHYNFLQEALLLKRLKSKWLARIWFKIEKRLGRYSQKRPKQEIIGQALAALEPYQYLYTQTGTPLLLERLLERPEQIAHFDIVASNQAWDALS